MPQILTPCDHCGADVPVGEMHALGRIEERVIDLLASAEDGPARGRGRALWLSGARRDPRVLVRTPRYEYVQVGYAVCADCLQRAEGEDQALKQFHRRATLVVASVAMGLAAVLVSVWLWWPGAYVALGVAPAGAAQPFAAAPPPSNQPYKPPFSAATPVAAP